MPIKYLHMPRASWLSIAPDPDPYPEQIFDTIRSSLKISHGAFTVEPPADTVFICECLRHANGYWQLGVKKVIATDKNLESVVGTYLDFVLTVTHIDPQDGEIIKTVELAFPEPQVPVTDASGLTAADEDFRNCLNFPRLDFTANALLVGEYQEIADDPVERPRPLGLAGGDGLSMSGFPAWAWIGAADAPIHGALLCGDWIVPQLSSALSVIAYNVVTEELVTIKNGFEDTPQTLAAYNSAAHDVGAYPWDTSGTVYEPSLGFSQERYSVIGKVRSDSFMIHVSRTDLADQFHSHFEKDFQWDYDTSPHMSAPTPTIVGQVSGVAYASTFGAKWINALGPYGNVYADDDVRGILGPPNRGLGVPTSSSTAFSQCGRMRCNPTRSHGSDTGAPAPEPTVTTAEDDPGTAAAVLFSEMESDLEDCLNEAKFGGMVAHDSDHWWEEFTPNEAGTALVQLSQESSVENGDGKWSNGDYVYRGRSIVETTESGSITGQALDDYPDDSPLKGKFKRLELIEKPGYLGHDGGALAWNQGRGHCVHYCSGNGTFTQEEGARVFDSNYGPSENVLFTPHSAHAGICSGVVDGANVLPENEYIPDPIAFPGEFIYSAYYCIVRRCYSPHATEGLQEFAKPNACHTGKYVTDGNLRIHFPREFTAGNGGVFSYIGSDSPEEHNAECRRTHQIIAHQRVVDSEGAHSWIIAWRVQTDEIVGVSNFPGQSYRDPRHGDCISNAVMTAYYVYCVLQGSDGQYLVKIAHSNVVVGGITVHTAGQVVANLRLADPVVGSSSAQETAFARQYTYDGILIENKCFRGIKSTGSWKLVVQAN